MASNKGADERSVETTLRNILESLDAQLAWMTMVFPLALVTIVPLVFFLLWLVVDETVRHSLVKAGGVCCALVALYLTWELIASRLARYRFDSRFPPGSPDRAVALRILAEMETPSKAEETLRVALASSSPDRIVRHRREKDDAPDAPPVQGGAAGAAPRPGGYYDYIPLEPRPADDSLPGGNRV